LSAGQSISDLLIQLKQKALAAADPSLDTASRQALERQLHRSSRSDFHHRQECRVQQLQPGRRFDQSGPGPGLADGTRRITAQAQNLKLSGAILTLTSTATVSTQTKASALIGVLQSSLTNVNSALAKLSSGAAKFSIQATFTQKLSDTLTAGIGNLVDANMAQESARLQSLQVKQQLGIQALSIANQAPQTILSLFRG
jgi:flagellin